jgi:TetR/AcrR family transcriptional regulator, cholesterol catabolism regulator
MIEPSPRERLLDAAEALFSEHGYAAVKLRHVAAAAGLHHSSLYHHAPCGKSQLFAEAVGRGLDRHGRGLREAVSAHAGEVRRELRAAAAWVLAAPASNHSRMVHTDLANLPAPVADTLARRQWDALVAPLAQALDAAAARGELRLEPGDAQLVGAALLSALQGLRSAVAAYPVPGAGARQADRLVDVLLDGLRPHAPPR